MARTIVDTLYVAEALYLVSKHGKPRPELCAECRENLLCTGHCGVDPSPVMTSVIFKAGELGALEQFQAPVKPVRGFNTWNNFQCGINQQLLEETATALQTTGL